MKLICKFIITIIIIWLCLIIYWLGLKIGTILYKTEKFIDNYEIIKEYSIDKDWIISIDPNENWIKIKTDPNCLEFKIKEK